MRTFLLNIFHGHNLKIFQEQHVILCNCLKTKQNKTKPDHLSSAQNGPLDLWSEVHGYLTAKVQPFLNQIEEVENWYS